MSAQSSNGHSLGKRRASSTPLSDDDDEAHIPLANRKRASNACQECRRRKARCDQRQPKCGQCERTGNDCVFIMNDKRKTRSRTKLDTIESRLNEDRKSTGERLDALERLIREAISGRRPASTQDSAVASMPTSSQPLALPSITEQQTPLSQALPPQSSPTAAILADQSSTDLAAPPSATSGHASLFAQEDVRDMPEGTLESIKQGQKTPWGIAPLSLAQQITGRDGRLSLGEGGQLRWFGATSNRHLSYEGLHLSGGIETQVSLHQRCKQALEQVGLGFDVAGLSPEMEDHLIDSYFSYHDAFFHLIDRATFYRHRSLYRKDPTSSRFYSPGLLYAILASAAHFSDEWIKISGVTPDRSGDVFVRRAQICVDEEMDSPQETTVAALALMAAKHAILGRDSRGWLLINSACACAIDLGLHSDVTPWLEAGRISSEHYRVRATTFWGVYCYAKLWALYVGRPSSFPLDSDVPHPATLGGTGESPPWEPLGERDASSPFQQYRALATPRAAVSVTGPLVSLLKITDNIVATLYASRRPMHASLERLCAWRDEVNGSLLSWRQDLSEAQRADMASSQAPEAHVIILNMQYYATQILLHRPFLHDNLPSAGHSDVSFETCVFSAGQTTQLLELYRKLYSFRRVSVVATHIIFTAATQHVYTIFLTAGIVGRLTESQATMRAGARKGLLICLAALSAFARSEIHARRSYMLIILLMKKWGLALDHEDAQPPVQSSNGENYGGNAMMAGHDSSQQFDLLSRELIALSAGDTYLDNWLSADLFTPAAPDPNATGGGSLAAPSQAAFTSTAPDTNTPFINMPATDEPALNFFDFIGPSSHVNAFPSSEAAGLLEEWTGPSLNDIFNLGGDRGGASS